MSPPQECKKTSSHFHSQHLGYMMVWCHLAWDEKKGERRRTCCLWLMMLRPPSFRLRTRLCVCVHLSQSDSKNGNRRKRERLCVSCSRKEKQANKQAQQCNSNSSSPHKWHQQKNCFEDKKMLLLLLLLPHSALFYSVWFGSVSCLVRE